MQSPPEPDRSPRAAVLAGSIAFGWVLADFLVFRTGGELALVCARLLPGSLVAMALAALLGWALAERRRTQVGLLIALGASAVFAHTRTGAHSGFPSVLLGALTSMLGCFILLEAALGRFEPRPSRARWKPSPCLIGIALGTLACTLFARLLHGAWYPQTPILSLTLALLAAGLAPAQLRLIGVAVAILLTCALQGIPTSPEVQANFRSSGAPSPDKATRASSGPNVLLIVLDTVRADHLSCYGYERETTPALDAFAASEATRFTQARSTSPFTLSSHGSLLTGLFPGEHGASIGGHQSHPLRDDVPMLGERFGALGYRTGAIFANTLYLTERNGFHRGFHHFDARRGTDVAPYLALVQMVGGNPRLGHSYRNARRISDLALDWISSDDRGELPFFLALNYMDAHGPFKPPSADVRALNDTGTPHSKLSFEARRELMYDAELRYLDRELGRFFDELRARGVFDQSLIVVTSDHGHAFGEHGHNDHCWMLYEEQLRVPLLVKPPGRRDVALNEAPINGAEVHDLLLTEAGFPPPVAAGGPGRLPEGLIGEWYPWQLTERNQRMQTRLGIDLSRDLITWKRGTIKTIVYSDGTVEAFDLERDPRELAPLELSPEQVQRAVEEAAAWWSTHPIEVETDEAMGAELLEDLREMGYG